MINKEHILICVVGSSDLKCYVKKADQFEACIIPPSRSMTKRQCHITLLDKNGLPNHDRARLAECFPESYKSLPDGYNIRDYVVSEAQSNNNQPDGHQSFNAVHDNDGKLLIYPAKIAPVVKGLIANGINIIGAMVIHTDRPYEKNEPVAAGPWVLHYLRSKFKLSDQYAKLINVFPESDNVENLEGRIDQPEDFPVRRVLVKHLEQEMNVFASMFDPRIVPLVLATGGMGPVKQLIESLTNLLFIENQFNLSTPEQRNKDKVKHDADEWRDLVLKFLSRNVTSRIDAVQARTRALDLSRRGDYAGAWAAVMQQSQSVLDQFWLQPLHLIARYFGGGSIDGSMLESYAGPKEIKQQLDNLNLQHNNVLIKYKRFAINAAYRMEAALQGNDDEDMRVVDALSALCTLIDTLVVARGAMIVHEKIEFPELSINESTGKVTAGTTIIKNIIDKKRGNKVSSQIKAWKDILNRNINAKTKMPLNESPIVALENALFTNPNTKKNALQNLRQLRNINAHEALNLEQICEIRKVATEHSIWRLDTHDEIGQRCLFKGGLIDMALREIDFNDSSEQYNSLIDKGLLSLLKNGHISPNYRQI